MISLILLYTYGTLNIQLEQSFKKVGLQYKLEIPREKNHLIIRARCN